MSFIPNPETPKNKIGTVTILKRDIKAMKGTILKGSEVLIMAIGPRGFDIQDIESKEIIIECGFDF